MDNGLRDKILAQPAVILEDQDVMRALIEANDQALGSNIVDLRGVAMKRLEAQLGRLEDTNRSVIAAAYENLAGTNQVHRAVLALMEPTDFDDFLKVDIRVGQVLRAEPYPEARKPAIKMWIDFGPEIGEKRTSAQVTAHYTPESLVGQQVMAVVNFPPRQIGKFMSEVLVLGVSDAQGGIVLLAPDQPVPIGGRMH